MLKAIITYITKKIQQTSEYSKKKKKKQTHRYREQISGYSSREEGQYRGKGVGGTKKDTLCMYSHKALCVI